MMAASVTVKSPSLCRSPEHRSEYPEYATFRNKNGTLVCWLHREDGAETIPFRYPTRKLRGINIEKEEGEAPASLKTMPQFEEVFTTKRK